MTTETRRTPYASPIPAHGGTEYRITASVPAEHGWLYVFSGNQTAHRVLAWITTTDFDGYTSPGALVMYEDEDSANPALVMRNDQGKFIFRKDLP